MNGVRRSLMNAKKGSEPLPLYAVTKADNPEVMAVCYAQGWAADENFMTFEEAAAVTDIGTVFRNKGLTHFKEFIYFIGITTIKTNAFSGNSLTSLSIPPNVTIMQGNSVFSQPLEYLYLPPNIIDFQGNSDTNFNNNNSSNFELHLDNWEAYCKSTGASCARLFTNNNNTSKIYVGKQELPSTVIIPNGVTSIRRNLLAGYNMGTKLIIPNTVTTINDRAFSASYNGWVIIDIGSGVTSIGQYGFSNARKCSTIICRAMTAPTLTGSDVFQWEGYSVPAGTTKRLVVPRGSTGYDSDQWKTVLQDARGYVLTYLDEYE